jgi:hypothetical protein
MSHGGCKNSSDGGDDLSYIGGKQESVVCKQCDSANQSRFNGEIVIHYPGPKGLNKPLVIFPEALGLFALCLHGFMVPERELRLLEKDLPAAMQPGRERGS